MTQITLEDYFMERERDYPPSQELLANAATVVLRVNRLLKIYGVYIKGKLGFERFTHVTSGYRPREVNQGVPGAAKNSNHIMCRAIDLYDPTLLLNKFCMENPKVLEECELWMEQPTGPYHKHCHLQIIPPPSKKRVFIG